MDINSAGGAPGMSVEHARIQVGGDVAAVESTGCNVPVVMLVYRRPDKTAAVLEKIAQVAPTRLYVVADGPNPNRPGDVERCQQVRDLIASRVTWTCEQRHNYADVNLGLKKRVSSGLNWVFEHEERAIIIEDDCRPSPDFFTFCDEMLEKYADTPQVMAVTGTNVHDGAIRCADSYYFSRYALPWGWATWRRAWTQVDIDMLQWKRADQSALLRQWFETAAERRFWRHLWKRVVAGTYDSWHNPWQMTLFMKSALAIVPAVNLVTNIGFDREGTHTRYRAKGADLPTMHLEKPLRHPAKMERWKAGDDLSSRLLFSRSLLVVHLFRHLVRLVRTRGQK